MRIAADLLDRLGDVQRDFADVAIIGARRPELIAAMRARGMRVTVVEANARLARDHAALCADEDRLPLDPASMDLILWPGGLESVNDVPAALLRARLALRPDGLLLGALVGDGSLPRLRSALTAATAARPAARMHPQISLAALGDLLGQVGLALPVVDIDRVAIAYRSLDQLVADLRAAALTAVISGPVPPLTRRAWADARQHFAMAHDAEQLRILHFSAWAPAPGQPLPARRGSATRSLKAALGPPTSRRER